MIRSLQIVGILICMHVLGSTVLFSYISDLDAIFAAPLLGLLGWYFIFPEIIGVGLQWIFYDPYPRPSRLRVFCYVLLSAAIGGIVVALFVPKEQANESNFWIAGFLAGAIAASFSFLCVHLIKSSEYKPTANKAVEATG